MTSLESMLEIDSATKRFGRVSALHELSLSLYCNQIALLLGPNGSGKSTLLRVAAGLSTLDSGKVLHTMANNSKLRIGYHGHNSQLYSALTVQENITLFLKLAGSTGSALPVQVNEIIAAWGLSQFSSRRVAELSKGLQSRVSLACTFIAQPQVALLDEPSSALDDRALQYLFSGMELLAKQSGQAYSILIATHDLERLRSCAGRILLLEDGKIRADSASMAQATSADSVIEIYRKENR